MFELHPQLKKDTFFIKDLKLCQVLLMNNTFYPWLILVPKKPEIIEIIDLSKEEQTLLMEEISLMSAVLKIQFSPDKLNIAALGNIVPQLHIHIIARFKNDISFPNPVWCNKDTKPYNDDDLKKVIGLLKDTTN